MLSSSGYDNAGNLTQIGGHRFKYDAEGHQAAAYQTSGSTITGYVYDGDGRRVAKLSCPYNTDGVCTSATTGETVSTTFAYDAQGRLMAEYGGTTAAAGTQYFSVDHLGSTRAVTDSAGLVVKRMDYVPYGELLVTSNRTTALGYEGSEDANNLRQRFTGKERDAETNLDYFGARYFSAAQGRFTSPDPLLASGRTIEPQTWNRYAYVGNNPLRYVDPNGLDYYDQNGNRIGAGGDGSNYVVTDAEEIKRIKASKSAVALNSLSSTTVLPNATVAGALSAAVSRSNNPTADDPKGGFHEEGGIVGLDAAGAQVVVPAAAGAADPTISQGSVNIAIGVPANPADVGRIVTPQVGFHIHPAGQIQTSTGPSPGTVFGGTTTVNTRNFNQPPSAVDRANAAFPMNIVVGARNGTIYFYNQGGVTATFPLNRLSRLR